MANNTNLNGVSIAGGDVIRDIDKGGVKTQVVTLDLGGAGAEQLVSGTLPVSGTVALDSASLAALESISVQNFPATQAVSGNVGIADGANTAQVTASREQVIAFKDLVSTAATITAQDIASTSAAGANGQSLITGTPTAGSVATQTITGESSFALLILGTWTGTLQFERSLDDGATWTSIGAFAAGTPFIVTTTTANGAFHGNSSSATTLRVRSTAAWTGSASVKFLAGAGTGTITIGNPIRLFDSVSGVQGTIKAASTLPVATDTAMSVTLRDAATFNRIDARTSGTISAAGNIVALTNLNGAGTATVQLVGTYSASVSVEGTVNGTDWSAISGVGRSSNSIITTFNSGTGLFQFPVAGLSGIRLNCTAFTSGSVAVNISASGGEGSAQLAAALPTGANTIGSVNNLSTISELRRADLVISTKGAAGAALTATLPAAGAGLFHYITSIKIVKLYSTAGTASATGVDITTTNLPGSLAWTTEQLASAAGTAVTVVSESPATPIKSSVANTATTIVAPLQAQTTWRINVTYFTGA